MLDLTPCDECSLEYATNMKVCPLCGFPRPEGGEGGVREPLPDPSTPPALSVEISP
jgi:hypothetical protein